MKITYLGHSGFSVRTSQRLLIFDALAHDAPDAADNAIAFVSHAHADHYGAFVKDWLREERAAVVTGEGLQIGGVCLKRGQSARVGGAVVRAFGSTDEGSSFLAEADGHSIFHAGDFNFWSWRAESTEAEIEQARRAFEEMLEDMRGMAPDVAFFPVDPRMQIGIDEGALRFAEVARPRLIIPMHFWDQPRAALDFAGKAMPGGVRALALTEKGQSIEWEE